MGFEVLVSGAHCFCIFGNEGPQVRKGGSKRELDWSRSTYQQGVENGEDMVEKHLGGHDGSEPMTGDAVTFGKREKMNDSRSPVPALGRAE